MRGGYIYIVDDDEAVRASLSALFEANGLSNLTFSSAQEFLAMAATLNPGCVIADVRMPRTDGLEMQRRLVERGLPFPLIIITGHADVPLAVAAMKAGAVDFIEKPFAPEIILNRIKSLISNMGVPPLADVLSATATSRLKALSPREREVLEALLTGLSNKSIGYELGISPRTVEIHRARVMEKMGARSLSELVRMGLAAGLQPPLPGRMTPNELR
jgi:two-component system, LuxR family, response regulator FixJ